MPPKEPKPKPPMPRPKPDLPPPGPIRIPRTPGGPRKPQ